MSTKKNYTLYLYSNGEELDVFKGTLLEIDQLTVFFKDKNALYINLVKKERRNENFQFYIRSSKGNSFPVIFYQHNGVLNRENSDLIIDELRKKTREELSTMLENNTQIMNYDKETLNDRYIPLCRLYTSLSEKGNMYMKNIQTYVKSDYQNYRVCAKYIVDKTDAQLSNLKFWDKQMLEYNIKKLREEIEKKQIKLEKMKQKNISVQEIYKEPSDNENDIYSIIDNENMELEDKINELEMLIQDEDKLRDAKNMLYQKKM